MANLDWSISSSLVSGDDLVNIDPEVGVTAIRRAISLATDGRIFDFANHWSLNTDCDVGVLRDRVTRYEIRRHFGANTARWRPEVDKAVYSNSRSEDRSSSPRLATLESETHAAGSSGQLVPLPQLHQTLSPAHDSSVFGENRLPTGQTIGAYRDPMTPPSANRIPAFTPEISQDYIIFE